MSGGTQSSSLLSGKVENNSNLNYNTKALLPQHDGLHILLWPCSKYFQSWRQHLQVTHTGSFGGGKTERKEENAMISPHDVPLSQIPAWSAPFIINRCGRRGSQATFFLLSTVFSCGYALICQVITRDTSHVSH